MEIILKENLNAEDVHKLTERLLLVAIFLELSVRKYRRLNR